MEIKYEILEKDDHSTLYRTIFTDTGVQVKYIFKGTKKECEQKRNEIKALNLRFKKHLTSNV